MRYRHYHYKSMNKLWNAVSAQHLIFFLLGMTIRKDISKVGKQEREAEYVRM